MGIRFVGGPLNDLTFNHEQINAVGMIQRTWSETGGRVFLQMPSPEECGRLLRENLPKNAIQGGLHTYERIQLANGDVEFHDAAGALGHAMREQHLPLDDEQRERKRLFGEYADRFQEQVRLFDLTPDSEATLVFVYHDRQGNTVRAAPQVITSTTRVEGFGDTELARQFVTAAQREALLGNINSLVRNAPTDFVDYPGSPSGPLVIQSFEFHLK